MTLDKTIAFLGGGNMAEAVAKENISGVSTDELSMGMSGYFEVAVEEGAMLVRVGTAIFGERT